jgi:hypothetical protein
MLVGMFSEQATEKLRKMAEALLTTAPAVAILRASDAHLAGLSHSYNAIVAGWRAPSSSSSLGISVVHSLQRR